MQNKAEAQPAGAKLSLTMKHNARSQEKICKFQYHFDFYYKRFIGMMTGNNTDCDWFTSFFVCFWLETRPTYETSPYRGSTLCAAQIDGSTNVTAAYQLKHKQIENIGKNIHYFWLSRVKIMESWSIFRNPLWRGGGSLGSKHWHCCSNINSHIINL